MKICLIILIQSALGQNEIGNLRQRFTWNCRKPTASKRTTSRCTFLGEETVGSKPFHWRNDGIWWLNSFLAFYLSCAIEKTDDPGVFTYTRQRSDLDSIAEVWSSSFFRYQRGIRIWEDWKKAQLERYYFFVCKKSDQTPPLFFNTSTPIARIHFREDFTTCCAGLDR